MDDRAERLRHLDLADLVDRVLPSVSAGTPRQLVQVYNGGNMPSQPDRYYLTNPVYVNGPETEGGVGSLSTDTSQTIVVDVIGKAPSAGDYLTAYAVGGRWVAELTNSQTAKGCIQFLGCNGTPLQGVTVSIYDHQGGNLKAGPLTSDSQGKVCPGLDAGTYWVDPTGDYSFPLDKYVWTAQNFGIPSGGVALWPVQLQPGYGCCSSVSFPLPTTLYLTVCGQTFTLVSGGTMIEGWAPVGGTAIITTPFVANVTTCNLGGWDGTTSTQAVPWAVRLLCPPNATTMNGLAGVCGIGHYNGRIGGFDLFAICPAECTGVGNAYTCCNGGGGPGPTVPFALSGTIGDTVSLTGAMPGAMPTQCVFPPAAPWPLPCAGQPITVTS